MTPFIYIVPPIDLRWNALATVSESLQTIARSDDTQTNPDRLSSESVKQFLNNWEEAKILAARAGWEGDFSEDPRVFWVPDELEFKYGFAIKQANGGMTFIASPKPLPWLAAIALND